MAVSSPTLNPATPARPNRAARSAAASIATGLVAACHERAAGRARDRCPGRPSAAVKLLYEPDADSRIVRISTTADRLKAQNLARDPQAALHVPGRDFWHYAVAEGDVTLSAVASARATTRAVSSWRYHRRPCTQQLPDRGSRLTRPDRNRPQGPRCHRRRSRRSRPGHVGRSIAALLRSDSDGLETARLVPRHRPAARVRPQRQHRPHTVVDGKIVGSWGITPAGELRLKVIADRGRQRAPPWKMPRHVCTNVSRSRRHPPRSTHPSSAHSLRG